MQLGTRLRGELLADPIYQQRHLIPHQPDIAGRGREHRKTGPIADRHQQHDPAFEFHHRLHDLAGVEAAGRTLSQADQPGRHCGELVSTVPLGR